MRRRLGSAVSGDERCDAERTLAGALAELGDRQTDAAALEEAIGIYRSALSQTSRERSPAAWAALQSGFGAALRLLGLRTGDPGTFEAAAAACREALRERRRADEALKERTPARAPLGHVLGESEGCSATLREAVAAFGAALQVHSRERSPYRWATTKTELGVALIALGRQEGDVVAPEEAVRVLRQALEERPRERGPMAWARTLADLAQALFALGDVRGSVARVREALATWDEARAVLSADSLPEDDADTRRLIDDAKRWLQARGEAVE